MRDISFGQYYPVKSVIHRCDPRVKLIIAIGYIVMLFFIPTVNFFLQRENATLVRYMITAGICYFIALLFILIATILSKVPPLKVLKSVRMILFLVLFMTIFSALFYNGNGQNTTVLAQWWIFTITTEGLVNAGAMALRFMFMVLGLSLLTLTTTPVELTEGIESLLSPLKLIRVRVHVYAIIMSIALRLIPTLIEETGKIMNAQKARCADFESGNLYKKAKALMPVLIPLFVLSFRRADELSYAMDSRCYRGSKGRTKMKKLKFRLRDFFCLIAFALTFFAILTLRYNYFGALDFILGFIF